MLHVFRNSLARFCYLRNGSIEEWANFNATLLVFIHILIIHMLRSDNIFMELPTINVLYYNYNPLRIKQKLLIIPPNKLNVVQNIVNVML